MQIGRRHVHGQEQTKRIDENMTLTSFYAFMRIEATDPGRFLNRLDALRINDRCARLAIPPDPLTFGFPESREQPKPGAGIAQPAKMIEHRLEGVGNWLVSSERRHRVAQDVEDRIENGALRVGWRPASFGLRREIALQTLPLRIR